MPDYPVPGRCIGDGVRLRAEPAAEAEVVGHVDREDFLYVLSERLVDGETWYEVDHPARPERVWISGRYLETDRAGHVSPAHALVWRVELDFGATLVKPAPCSENLCEARSIWSAWRPPPRRTLP